ncbi:MAG TPA: GNAT family protein [bacterium]
MTPVFDPQPITLSAPHVRLEPLSLHHAKDLYEAGLDTDIWTYLPRAGFASLEDTRGWITEVLADAKAGAILPFAQVDPATGRAFGSTRYLDIQRKNRGLEIGWTWIGQSHRRTPVNTEAKYLLLRHAFESLGAVRVQLKTDVRNVRSQNAILRIGAQREGILRHNMILPNGYIRDSVYFSVTNDEWPEVKRKLEAMMAPTASR